MTYHVLTLGTAAVHASDGTPIDLPLGKPAALLIQAAVERQSCTREELAAFFWPAAPRDKALQSLRQALWLLRRTLGDEILLAGDAIAITPDAVRVDVHDLFDHLAAGRLDEADALWKGPFLDHFALAGVPGWERWVDEVGGRVNRRLAGSLLARGLDELRDGSLAAAADRFRRAAVIEPFEHGHRLALAGVLIDLRRFAEAEEALFDVRRDDPDPETTAEVDRLDRRLAEVRSHAREGGPERPEFVGRAAEFAELMTRWRGVRQRRSACGFLRGPSGIGKSRLAEELAAAVRSDGGSEVWVKATEAERSIEGALIASLVKRLLLMPGSGGVSGASDAVLRSLVPSLDRRVTADGAGAGFPPPATLSDAVVDVVGAVAYEAPLLIVLDDIHWADPVSRSILARVLHHIRDEPVLFVLTYRPEDVSADTRRMIENLERSETSAALALRSFDRSEIAEFLSLAAEFSQPDHADTVVDRFFKATGGNPLFLVELLNALADDGILVRGEGGAILHTERIGEEFPTPRSVQVLIARRFDRRGEEAAAVASVLAHAPANSSVEDLQADARLGAAGFNVGLHELIDRELVRWERDALVFAHDQLRAEATRRFSSRPPKTALRSLLPRTLAARATIGIAAAAALLLATMTIRAASAGADPAWGGGTLYLVDADSFFVAIPPAGRDGEWRVEQPAAPAPRGTQVYGPYLEPSGELVWYENVQDTALAPYIARILPDGSRRIVARVEGDAGFGSLSPDGKRISLFQQRPPLGEYWLDLLIANADGSDARVIHSAAGHVSAGWWSPDGRRLASLVTARPDTIRVFSAAGDPLLIMPVEPTNVLGWCDEERLLVATNMYEDPRLGLFDATTGSIRKLNGGRVVGPAACSPDGTAIAYPGVRGGRVVLLLHEIATAEESVITTEALTIRRWLPADPRIVETAVTITATPSTLRVGERAPLGARVLWTDGRTANSPVQWKSSEENTVSVSAAGVATGNRAGTAEVIAKIPTGYADTITIRVDGAVEEGVIVRDAFTNLDQDRWIPMGPPHAVATRFEGEPALFLNGDGRYTDGLLLRDSVSLAEGATLEAEFRLNLTRRDRQRFELCLVQATLLPGGDASFLNHWDVRNAICAHYPSGELSHQDPGAISFHVNPVQSRISLPNALPPDGWIHIAIQVRPDGRPSLFVDREHVADSDLFPQEQGIVGWRIQLTGASVDTRVLVRNLTLWTGLRY